MANKIISIQTVSKQSLYPETYIDIAKTSSSITKTITTNGEDKEIVINTLNRNVDIEAVKGAIKNIFTWNKGERILNPEFGANLRQYLYEGLTDLTKQQIQAEIEFSLKTFEPRVEIDKITGDINTDDAENNELHVYVIYHIKGLPEDKYIQRVI